MRRGRQGLHKGQSLYKRGRQTLYKTQSGEGGRACSKRHKQELPLEATYSLERERGRKEREGGERPYS
jgi:hypothetical protein